MHADIILGMRVFSPFVDMDNGVRQGCTLAPLIWALYSVFLIHQVEINLNSRWPREAITLYADDTHCAWELDSLSDLRFLFAVQLPCFLYIRDMA